MTCVVASNKDAVRIILFSACAVPINLQYVSGNGQPMIELLNRCSRLVCEKVTRRMGVRACVRVCACVCVCVCV